MTSNCESHVKTLSYGSVRVRPSNDVRTSSKADVFYNELRPLILVFRTMGVLPIQRPSPGAASFKLLSVAMLYSVTVYLLIGIPMTISGMKTTHRLMEDVKDFNDYILTSLQLVYVHQYWIIPIVNWREAGNMALYFNSWTEFQELYEHCTGLPLHLSLRRRLWYLLALSLLATSVSSLTSYNFFDAWTALPWIYLHLLLNFLALLWHIICKALGLAADQVAASLLEALKGEGLPSLLAERRLLWMRLSKLIKQFGEAVANTFSHFCLFMFVTLLAGAYGAICDVTGSGFNYNQPWIFSVFLHSIIMLYVLCSSAHVATTKAGADIQEAILLTDLSVVSAATKSEVELLLVSMSMSAPTINLNGHVQVNRSMLISLLSTVVTYLVVLLQFQLGWSQSTAATTTAASTALGCATTTTIGPIVANTTPEKTLAGLYQN